MPKPKRTHPGFDVAQESAQGREFLRLLQAHVGEQLRWTPIQTTGEGTRVFLLAGARGQGLLLVAEGNPQGADWVQEWAFLWEPPAEDVVAHVGLVAFRRDARAEGGGDKDRLSLWVGAPDRLPEKVASVDRGTVERLRMKLRSDAPRPASPEVATPPDPTDGPPLSVLRVRARVEEVLTSLLGRVEVEPDADFTFRYQSARVFVNVKSWGEGSTLVNVWSITNRSVPVSEEFFRYIATHSDRWVLGHLAAEEQDGSSSVVFRHTLLGEPLHPEELKHVLTAVATTADELDDEIRDRFGGEVFDDVPGGRKTRPPEPSVPGYL